MAFCEEKETITVDQRPCFGPCQVRAIDEIKPGRTFIAVNRVGKVTWEEVVILSLPKEGKVKIRVLPKYEGLSVTETHKYLSDFSVVPYEGGAWNNANCLLRKEPGWQETVRKLKPLPLLDL
ncbi:hypothetical protein J7L09_02700 [bacterium]|nr:hypothetical protein [bacterium]